MKRSLLILSVLLLTVISMAQVQKHVVFLKNKDNNPYSINNPSAFLTQRALDRRAKSGIALDEKDLPVTPSYVTQVAATGAQVIYSLKWFNAVVVSTSDPAVLQAIAALPFVDYIDMVHYDQPGMNGQHTGIKSSGAILPVKNEPALARPVTKSTGTINYGQAYNQAHMIAVDGLHDLGFTGEGMVIAVLDAGFYHVDIIPAFDSLFLNGQILGTRDYHIPGNNVYGDDMHTHGTSVLSTMGANLPGEMVGTAPHASYWLVRTEVGETESLVEEYNWAAGAEFADSIGADIINSSLGYTLFDSTVFNHSYADMDGNTTPVTRAADLAASRGILVVNSAGNEGGSSWKYVGAPADGDSVFSIGAVDANGFYAGFSSTGPTYDGRTKPDVTAQGSGTTVVSGWGFVWQGSGTSFSSPVTAGALACLWQSVPAFSAQEIRNAVRNTASQATSPDQLYGYGIPNMTNARLYLGIPTQNATNAAGLVLTPNPFRGSPVVADVTRNLENVRVEVLSANGLLISAENQRFSESGMLRITALENRPAGLYLVKISAGEMQQVLRAVKF